MTKKFEVLSYTPGNPEETGFEPMIEPPDTWRMISSFYEIRKYWTPFSAQIVSKIKGECSVQGSFIVIADNPEKQEMRERQELNSEVIKNKIVETLKAFLEKYSAAAIISTHLREPVKFERAIKKLLWYRVDEAHGVIINVQNITTGIINHSSMRESSGKAIDKLNEQIIKGLSLGATPDEINDLERRKREIEKFVEEEEEKLRQSGNSSSEGSVMEEHNPLIEEVNRLLFEGNTF